MMGSNGENTGRKWSREILIQGVTTDVHMLVVLYANMSRGLQQTRNQSSPPTRASIIMTSRWGSMAVAMVQQVPTRSSLKHRRPYRRSFQKSASEKSIFLLAGQSNMAGRGGTYNIARKWDGITPPECQSDPRILRLNNDLLWEEAHEPLHQNISFSACSNNSQPIGIGPGMAFANYLLKRDPAIGTIGLVPCAVGDTSIIQWSKGSCLYIRLLARARASLRDGGTIRAMLWYQGENDAKTIEGAKSYKMRLETFFKDLQSDLKDPSLPIIQVALASGGDNIFDRDIVREAQLSTTLPNVECVDALGLHLYADNLHLTTEAQVQLGSKFEDTFLE